MKILAPESGSDIETIQRQVSEDTLSYLRQMIVAAGEILETPDNLNVPICTVLSTIFHQQLSFMIEIQKGAGRSDVEAVQLTREYFTTLLSMYIDKHSNGIPN
jgi:hypothetical protein